MMRALLPLLLLASTTTARAYDATDASFEVWRAAHGRSYDDAAARAAHLDTWLSNLQRVESHNARFDAGETTYRVGMNIHADLTQDQYRALRLRARRNPRTAGSAHALLGAVGPAPTAPPAAKNWVDSGIIVGIKDQGQCGSCWGFSAVAAMEGAYNYQLQQKQQQPDKLCNSTCGPKNVPCCSFSEQEVVDCTNGGADTCSVGGEMHDGVLEVVSRGGKLSTEAAYPYVSGTTKKLTKCQPKSDSEVATGVKGYKNVTSGSEDALLQAIAQYPVVSVAIDASGFGFQLYTSGVYVDEEGCGNNKTSLDHGVAVVGWGSGSFAPPGPLPPNPGPSNCQNNFKKPACVGEKGCVWCPDTPVGYCSPTVCVSPGHDTVVNKAATTGQGKKPIDYWIVRNSWGLTWGLGGYIAMARNHDNMCGIATDAIVAVV